MEKKDKRFIIIGVITIVILCIGITLAYFIPNITGEEKEFSYVVGDNDLHVVFTETTELVDENTKMVPGWSITKTFTVENQSEEVYYYNIVIEDLINEIESNTLEYKIESEDGYSMNDFKLVPSSLTEETKELVSHIEIAGLATHSYTVTFRYVDSDDIDQSVDLTKRFGGNLYITPSTQTLAQQLHEKMKEQYPNTVDTERTHFNNVVGENDNSAGSSYDVSGAYSISGKWAEEGNKVYYYSGNVQNNWVSFAGFYWRIIRTNEDGSIRLLYGGPETDKGNSTNQYIGSTRQYNDKNDDTMYVGFKYGTSGTLSSNRTNDTNSSILGLDEDTNITGSSITLNGWYNQNLKKSDEKTDYQWDKYISRTAIYCNDRAHLGTYQVKSIMHYAAVQRLTTKASSTGGVKSDTDFRPSYKCGVDYQGNVISTTASDADKFSGVGNSLDNKTQLANPIGLITADEIVFAGGKSATKSSKAFYYLTADGKNSAVGGNSWWTMSPFDYGGSYVIVFSVRGSDYPGYLDYNAVSTPNSAVRPVISLKSCLKLSDADGTADDPYLVESITDTCAEADN